jgi:hypothetical protein
MSDYTYTTTTYPINKYTLAHVSSDGTTIVVSFEHDSLSDVLSSMQSFLLAVGFSIKGTLEVVEEEEE